MKLTDVSVFVFLLSVLSTFLIGKIAAEPHSCTSGCELNIMFTFFKRLCVYIQASNYICICMFYRMKEVKTMKKIPIC